MEVRCGKDMQEGDHCRGYERCQNKISMTKHVSASVEEKFGDGIFNQEIPSAVLDDVSKRNGNEETNEEIYATLLEMYRLQRASGFQITGDNVYLARLDICQHTNKIKAYTGSI